jgi:hypothetical protein
MYWRLSHTVTACLAGDRILILDIGRDRYSSVPPTIHEPFLFWLQSGGDQPPASCRAVLSDLGIGNADAGTIAAPVESSIPRARCQDSETLPRRRVGPGELLSVGQAVVSALRDIRFRPLATVLKRRFPAGAPPAGPVADLWSKLALFRSARLLIPVPRVCLHDCLALMAWLGPSASGVALVFGVCARPFAAHCWLQSHDLVLDDHPESPSRYQPILHLP